MKTQFNYRIQSDTRCCLLSCLPRNPLSWVRRTTFFRFTDVSYRFDAFGEAFSSEKLHRESTTRKIAIRVRTFSFIVDEHRVISCLFNTHKQEFVQFILSLTNSLVWWMRSEIGMKLYWLFPVSLPHYFRKQNFIFLQRKRDGKQCYDTMDRIDWKCNFFSFHKRAKNTISDQLKVVDNIKQKETSRWKLFFQRT